jgi:hypothetical protein
MAERPIRSREPVDRLTRMCDAAILAFENHPEYLKGDKCIVFLDTDVEKRSGLVLHGYDDDMDALVNLFMHMRAIFRANGKDLMFAPLGGEG